jgi:hypothetical protein
MKTTLFRSLIVLTGITLFVIGSGMASAANFMKGESYGKLPNSELISTAKFSALEKTKSISPSGKTQGISGYSWLQKPDEALYSQWYTTFEWDPWFIYSMENYGRRISPCHF